MAPQMPPAGNNMSNNTIGRSTRGADYNKEALHQIRASLQPYAHGGPRERLSPNVGALFYPSHYGLQHSDEDFQRVVYNGYPNVSQLHIDNSKIIRKSSFERDLNLQRGSPALDSNASTRSDSPGMPNSLFYSRSVSGRQYIDTQRLDTDISLESPLGCANRQYVYGCGTAPEPPPPPPPPRSQGHPPPPTPPRGTTPPPHYSSSASSAATIVSSGGQMPLFLSRLSPGPGKTKSTANYVNISSVSQSPTPQRGTSPVSLVCRPPIVVQNNPQVQQQLIHQIQALSLNSNTTHGYPQVERPPPYPINSQVKSMTGVKMTTPPPTYNSGIQNRQSPTQESRKSPQLVYQAGGMAPPPASPVSYSPTMPMVPPVVRGGQTARQAKTPTPIIMQSVKSTQVQKPVLQTAVAPASPPVTSPPPSYASSIQQRQTQASGLPTQSVGSIMQESSISVSHSLSSYSPANAGTLPTSEPPSYHSTMQAMAAARGCTYMPQPVASIPMEETPVQDLDLSSTPLAHIPISPVTTVDSIVTTQPSSHVETVSSCHSVAYDQIGCHPPLQRKYSPAPTDTTSSASRSESPSSSVTSHDTHALSNSPVSCLSIATSTPSTQSDMTQESGYSSSSQSTRMLPPPPPPPAQKTMHQSPIPERKKLPSEIEEQRCESKVKVYSPEAYKFFMEQHVENVLKFHDQRKQRKLQLEKEFKKIHLSTEAQSEVRKMLSQKESNYIRLKRAKMNRSMFQEIQTIGVGAFGEVSLVRKIGTRRLYAMKTLRKSDVLKRNQVAHVKAERDILAEADNEWVVKLYYSFQDKGNLYLIMDYIPGGDLMSLLIKSGIFEEPLARFYIGELVCAVESVHKMGFIHRDIKPDNILIDRDGHIKLTDFGLCTGFRWTHNSKYYQRQGDHDRQESIDPCGDNDVVCRCNDLKPLERRRRRQHLRCLAHSLVGTPNYIAPEVLARSGYTQLCDWWSVGVILYEMLVGQPPFLANTPSETQYKVINWETSLRIPKPAKLTSEAKGLIVSLCTHPDTRLGHNGAQEVKDHPFFGDLDFEGGLRKQQALYIPKIEHGTDTSNFDPIDPERLRPTEDGNDLWGGNNQSFHGFFEFTFRRFFDSTPSGTTDEKDSQHPVYV